MSTQESFEGHRKAKLGSDRSFGLVFAAVFGTIGLFPLIFLDEPRWWALALGAVFAVFAFLASHLLTPLNRGWYRIGLALHRIVNPLLMAVLYFLAVVPTGLALRAFGKELLSLRQAPEQKSYWIERTPPGPDRGTFTKQF